MRKKEGRGGRRDEEVGGMGKKEGGGGRRDEESQKMKNEKVARGRIIGLAGPCSSSDRQVIMMTVVTLKLAHLRVSFHILTSRVSRNKCPFSLSPVQHTLIHSLTQ